MASGTRSSSCSQSADVDLYRVTFDRSVAEVIRRLHPELKRKVRTVLDVIREDPTQGKVLQDDLSGLRSARVGHFRIVYRIGARRVIEVVALGPRRTIYADTGRLLRRVREGEQ